MNIQTFPSNQVTETAKQFLQTTISRAQKYPVLLMLSGGSSLKLLEHLDPQMLNNKLTLTVLDERYSTDPKVNNWLQIEATDFYQQAVSSGVTTIPTVPKHQESLETFAKRWEKDLRKWFKNNNKRTVVATIGIGNDGHVAGISPFPKQEERFLEFIFTSDWVKGYSGNLEPAERVTVTAKFMEDKIDHAIVFVSGEGKREALEKVLANEGMMAQTPARILREMKDVSVFTDLENF